MSIAEQIQLIVSHHQWGTAVTFAGGYMLVGRDTVRFPTGRESGERRNEKGRCTYTLLTYADGSRMEFRWHPQHGPRLKVLKP